MRKSALRDAETYTRFDGEISGTPRIRSQARLRAHAGAARRRAKPARRKRAKSARAEVAAAPVRGAAARRAPHALGFPARARRRAEELGDSEGAEPRRGRAADGRADRGPPARIRGVRGRDPEGRVRRRNRVVWDRGFWQPIGDPRRGLAAGKLDFTLAGEKLRGRLHLVRMKPRASAIAAARAGS